MHRPVGELFLQILMVCDQLDLIGKDMFAVDGRKISSNASKEWIGLFVVDAGLVDLTTALLVLFARSTKARLIDNFSDTGHLFSNSSGNILMFKVHLASQLLTTLTLQLFRAIFLLYLNVGNDADSFVLDLNQHLREPHKRFPFVFLHLHIPLLFQTFGLNELINKSVYYLSTEVGDGFADIMGSQQTITLGVVSHSWSPYDAQSHSLRLISVMCFDRFVT